MVRPTAALFWLPYSGCVLWRQWAYLLSMADRRGESRWSFKVISELVRKFYHPALLSVAIVYFLGVVLDSKLYAWVWERKQTNIVAAYNFFEFNLLFDGGKFYGSHPIHW